MPSLIELKDKPGFYQVPGYFRQLAINKDTAEVYGIVGEKILPRNHSKLQYPFVNYRGKKLLIHRLMALTFLDRPQDYDKVTYIVNHKDGDKNNPSLSNLEWATYSENINHAYENNLKFDVTSVKVKDIVTGQIQEFISMGQCAKFFNCNREKIFVAIKPKNRGNVVFGKYLIVKKDEEFPELDAKKIIMPAKGKWMDFVVKDTLANKVYIFCSPTFAAKYINIKPGTLHMALHRAIKKGIGKVTFDHFELCYLTYFLSNGGRMDEAERIALDRPKTVGFVRKPKRIRVTELDNGLSYEMPSIASLAEQLDMNVNSLSKNILLNNGIFQGRLKVEYLPVLLS